MRVAVPEAETIVSRFHRRERLGNALSEISNQFVQVRNDTPGGCRIEG
ncbi:MAG: hypothetical protein ACJASX_002323 [Limisphaerales bacterium]|jgi:hypothetical protein